MSPLKAKIKLSDAQRSLEAGVIDQEQFEAIVAEVSPFLGEELTKAKTVKAAKMTVKKADAKAEETGEE